MTDAEAFSIRTAAMGDVLVVTVRGELDLTTAPELARARDLVAGLPAHVVVDLDGVTFLDSSGLNVLMAWKRSLARAGAGLSVVVDPSGPVRRVLEISQLVEALGVVESVDEALAGGAAR